MPDRTSWKRAALLAALLMSAAAASAQPPIQLKDVPSTPPDDVVITARPEPTAKQVEDQARAITPMVDFYHEPLARFEDPVCPGIAGLPAEAAAILIDRIRFDAERVGARVDPGEKCSANIIVAFVRDGGAEVRKLMKTSSFLFQDMDGAEARELRDGTGPVRAWNLTRLRTRHGEEQRPRLGDIASANLPPIPVIAVPSSDSRVFLAGRRDISYAVVIIDLAAIDGLPVARIADYVAMRALARTRPAGNDAAAGTILSLFDPAGRPPQEMTSFDLAYLRSLYAAGSNLPASAKIGGIQRELRKAEAEAQAIKVAAKP